MVWTSSQYPIEGVLNSGSCR